MKYPERQHDDPFYRSECSSECMDEQTIPMKIVSIDQVVENKQTGEKVSLTEVVRRGRKRNTIGDMVDRLTGARLN